TDVTGFGLVGHALNLARGSGVTLELRYDALPVHDAFHRLAKAGVSTGCTAANRAAAEPWFASHRELAAAEVELLFDPQTSGGLLLSVPADAAGPLLADLLAGGHRAAEIGEVAAGPPGVAVR
ncbi:MAG TPA: AIR synthase-related protein, partial [Thermoanaerobaculia bacterium]|nr:AIR synthase-related protein [Thermoanaerobaculia bacterium]